MTTRHAAPWTARHTIPSDTSVGSQLIGGLLEAMLERGWPASAQFHVQLAYEEAMINAVIHGNCRSREKTVEIQMSCDGDEVRIEITDQGEGFHPDSVPDPRRNDLLEVPGGRGILLMQEVLSLLEYNEKGNQCTLIKRKSDIPTTAEDRLPKA